MHKYDFKNKGTLYVVQLSSTAMDGARDLYNALRRLGYEDAVYMEAVYKFGEYGPFSGALFVPGKGLRQTDIEYLRKRHLFEELKWLKWERERRQKSYHFADNF